MSHIDNRDFVNQTRKGCVIMKLTPIINNKMRIYQKQNDFDALDDNSLFECFVNQMLLMFHNANAFEYASDLLDTVCVDGGGDMGIDGLVAKINGVFVYSIEDIDQIIKTQREYNVEFIFIQSKYKNSFSYGDYIKFTLGIQSFLNQEKHLPHNDKISHWLKIKDKIFSPEFLSGLTQMPLIRTYFATIGEWQNDQNIIHAEDIFKTAITQLNYGYTPTIFVDEKMLLDICNINDNSYSATISYIDMLSLIEVPNIENSNVVLVSAGELIKLLSSSGGLLRSNIFNDNVRDYQQGTSVNNDIQKTLQNNPDKFTLLNNGITIVCEKLLASNRKITFKNPQIVNGCQTCNEIFKAYSLGKDLSKVTIIIKAISTTDEDIINAIVQGTNKQNIVYDEAFEVTKPFHKRLEEFFIAVSADKNNDTSKLFYERRSKQFWNNPNIKITQKVNFKILIQSFVSVFLYMPEVAFRHESVLLDKFKDRIFNDSHSFYPYFCAAAIFLKLESFFRTDYHLKIYRPYKNQIAMLLPLIISDGKKIPHINQIKEVEIYCKKIIDILDEEKIFSDFLRKAISFFEKMKKSWILEKGATFRFAIKDSVYFTAFMLRNLSININDYKFDGNVLRTGIVSVIQLDSKNKICGFISGNSQKIFFHSDENKHIDCRSLYGKNVTYEITTINNARPRAINIRLINN